MNTNEIAEKPVADSRIKQLAFACAVEMEMFNHLTIRKSEIILGYLNQYTAHLQKENKELRGKLNRECENHDACRIQVEELQAEKATPATCEWTYLAEGWHKNPHTQYPVFVLNLKATPFCPYCGKLIAQVKGVVEREKSKAVATCGKCYHGVPFDQSCAECNAVIHPMQTDRNPRGA